MYSRTSKGPIGSSCSTPHPMFTSPRDALVLFKVFWGLNKVHQNVWLHISFLIFSGSLIGYIILLPPEVELWLVTKILFPAEVVLCSQLEYQRIREMLSFWWSSLYCERKPKEFSDKERVGAGLKALGHGGTNANNDTCLKFQDNTGWFFSRGFQDLGASITFICRLNFGKTCQTVVENYIF